MVGLGLPAAAPSAAPAVGAPKRCKEQRRSEELREELLSKAGDSWPKPSSSDSLLTRRGRRDAELDCSGFWPDPSSSDPLLKRGRRASAAAVWERGGEAGLSLLR